MKNKIAFFSRHFWEIFIIIILVSTLTYLYVQKIIYIKVEVFFTTIASIITLYLTFIKQKIEDDKVFRELFIDFNAKYSNEMNNLFNKLRVEENYKITTKDEDIIIDYFNLCAEEYFWFSKGRIPKEIWTAWEFGIIENFSLPAIKQIFDRETDSERKIKSYYGFVEVIKAKL